MRQVSVNVRHPPHHPSTLAVQTPVQIPVITQEVPTPVPVARSAAVAVSPEVPAVAATVEAVVASLEAAVAVAADGNLQLYWRSKACI